MPEQETTRHFVRHRIMNDLRHPTALYRQRRGPHLLAFEWLDHESDSWVENETLPRMLIMGEVDLDEVSTEYADAVAAYLRDRWAQEKLNPLES